MTVKQTSAHKLRASTYHGDDQDWHALLAHCLLQTPIDTAAAKAFEGLEIVASIGDDEEAPLNITFRKNISGITVRSPACVCRRNDLCPT